MLKWLTAKRLEYFTGITESAANTNIHKGIWIENIHWTKAPNGRRFFNFNTIQDWIEGKQWQSSNAGSAKATPSNSATKASYVGRQ